MLLKLPASSGKTGAMRAGITGTELLLMNGGANRGAGQGIWTFPVVMRR